MFYYFLKKRDFIFLILWCLSQHKFPKFRCFFKSNSFAYKTFLFAPCCFILENKAENTNFRTTKNNFQKITFLTVGGISVLFDACLMEFLMMIPNLLPTPKLLFYSGFYLLFLLLIKHSFVPRGGFLLSVDIITFLFVLGFLSLLFFLL